MTSFKEIFHILLSIIILTIVFGFNDNRASFDAILWTSNLIMILVAATITIFVHVFAHKIMAWIQGVECESRIWTMSQFGFRTRSHLEQKIGGARIKSFPVGALLAFLITIASNGQYFFAAIESFIVKHQKFKRLGKDFPHVTEFEIVKIAFAGPLANILLAAILILQNSGRFFEKLILMNVLFAVYHMIPFSSLDGSKIFFGSRPFYVFSALFIGLSAILIFFIPPIIALIGSLFVGGLASSVFYYFAIYKN